MIAGALRSWSRLGTAGDVLALRRATERDAARVLAWNNAPEVRARSIDPRPIAADEHARWFAARLGDRRGHLWIALHDGLEVGVVRIERADGPAGRISIVLDPSVRGRGLGRRVIALACAADGGPIVAEILADNHASRAAFAAAGFIPVDGEVAPAARPLVRYLWSPPCP